MSEHLRIAIFVNAFPVASETFILRQITGLVDLGHDVHIFANARGEDLVQHDAISRYELIKRTTFVEGPPESVIWEMPVKPVCGETWLPGAERPISNLTRVAKGLPVVAECARLAPQLTRAVLDRREYGYRAASWSGAYRLATLMRDSGHFDVLHAHFGPVANAFRFARDLFRAPLLVSFHGYDFCTVPRKEGHNVYDCLWKAADLFVANSRYTRERLLDLNCPAEKIAVLPVGLDPSRFVYRERTLRKGEKVRLLTVARLVEIKGHEFALRALAKLTEFDFHYDIVGDGPLRQKLTQLAGELGIRDRVTFHGARREDEVRGFFAQAHIFILTSVTIEGDAEGQGLVLQEAQASGVPVVATQHGAFPEGVAEPSWLVRERNADELAAKLRALITGNDQWPTIARAGRTFVEHRYNIRALNAQLEDLYRAALARFSA